VDNAHSALQEEDKSAVVDQTIQRQASLDEHIKLWEHNVLQAKAALAMSKKKLASQEAKPKAIAKVQEAQKDMEYTPLPLDLDWDNNVLQAEAALGMPKKKLITSEAKIDSKGNAKAQGVEKDPEAVSFLKGWKSTRDPKTKHLYYYKKDAKEAGGFKVQWLPPRGPSSAALAKQDPTTDSSDPEEDEVPHASNAHTAATLSGKPLALGAYEEDEFNPGGSEFFGPFRLDYSDHTVELPDWNLVVESSQNVKGRGNLIVGRGNSFDDADNSFVAGKHMNASGRANTLAGGNENSAVGRGVVVIGGEQNSAHGVNTVVEGGYRNSAMGRGSAIGGGYKNFAGGTFSSVSGGAGNAATGPVSVATGRRMNFARGEHAVSTQ